MFHGAAVVALLYIHQTRQPTHLRDNGKLLGGGKLAPEVVKSDSWPDLETSRWQNLSQTHHQAERLCGAPHPLRQWAQASHSHLLYSTTVNKKHLKISWSVSMKDIKTHSFV